MKTKSDKITEIILINELANRIALKEQSNKWSKKNKKSKASTISSAANKAGFTLHTTDSSPGGVVWNKKTHFRISLKKGSAQPNESSVGEIVANALEVSPNKVSIQNMGTMGTEYSKLYPTWRAITPGISNPIDIIFSGAASKNRGYEYEEKGVENFNKAGESSGGNISARQGTDVKFSDVFLQVGDDGEEVGVEYKASGGRFGQPTLQYDYGSQTFSASRGTRSKENAALFSKLLNNSSASGKIYKWMDAFRNAIAQSRNVSKDSISQFQTGTLSVDDYDKAVKDILKKNNLTRSDKVPVDIDQLIQYYRKKQAEYIQLENGGLFHLSNDPYDLGTTSFKKAAIAANITPSLSAEIHSSGRNKVIRATMHFAGGDFSALNSDVDLDDPDDRAMVIHTLTNRAAKSGMQKDSETKQVDFDLYESVRRKIRYIIQEEKEKNHSRLSCITESILLEELTRSDKKDIEKMIKKRIEADRSEQKKIIQKEFADEMKKTLGKDFFGNPGKFGKAIQEIANEELMKEFSTGKAREEVIDITKKVLKKFYREISFSSNQAIDRVKL